MYRYIPVQCEMMRSNRLHYFRNSRKRVIFVYTWCVDFNISIFFSLSTHNSPKFPVWFLDKSIAWPFYLPVVLFALLFVLIKATLCPAGNPASSAACERIRKKGNCFFAKKHNVCWFVKKSYKTPTIVDFAKKILSQYTGIVGHS